MKDSDKMPFGKHKGERMEDVLAYIQKNRDEITKELKCLD